MDLKASRRDGYQSFFFGIFYFTGSLKIPQWKKPRTSARVLKRYNKSLTDQFWSMPKCGNNICVYFQHVFPFEKCGLQYNNRKNTLHAHCSSHLFITVTVIVSAKTLLAHTVSLLRSHTTCQLHRRRGNGGVAVVSKQHLLGGFGRRDCTRALNLPAAADPSDHVDAARWGGGGLGGGPVRRTSSLGSTSQQRR